MMRRSFLRWWGPCALVALSLSASLPLAAGEMINVADGSASLSGYVYADINNSGDRNSYACGFFERGIPGVEILLRDLEWAAHIESKSDFTNESGYYEFTGLSPGRYSVTETQPLQFIRGKSAVGSAGGEALKGGDGFTEITLTAGMDAGDYNFGEWGLKARYISKMDLVVPEPSTFASLTTALLALAAFVRFRRRAC